jgi:glutathione S-transferase
MAQLNLTPPKKFVYFGIKTPVGMTSSVLLDIGGFDFEGQSVKMEEWGELKPKTPTGMLPYAEFADGSVMAESGAIARVIAGAAGLLGQGKDFATSEMLAGMSTDLNKKYSDICPTMFTVDKFDKAKYDAGKAGVIEFAEKIAKFLTPAGDRFTESGMTYGEVDLFCKLNCHTTGAIPEVSQGKLAAFYKRMAEVPAIKKYLDGQSKFGALGIYMIPPP